jgi:hypothetical protein
MSRISTEPNRSFLLRLLFREDKETKEEEEEEKDTLQVSLMMIVARKMMKVLE